MSDHDYTMALGTRVWFAFPEIFRPRRDELYIHMQNICRYNGAVQISLLDHLALMVNLPYRHLDELAPEHEDPILGNTSIQVGYAAIHDDAETVLGDVTSGLKRLLKDYLHLEEQWDQRFHDAQGMPLEFRNDPWVKNLDLTARILEMQWANHPAAKETASKLGINLLPGMEDTADKVLSQLNKQKIRWVETAYRAGKARLWELLDERK